MSASERVPVVPVTTAFKDAYLLGPNCLNSARFALPLLHGGQESLVFPLLILYFISCGYSFRSVLVPLVTCGSFFDGAKRWSLWEKVPEPPDHVFSFFKVIQGLESSSRSFLVLYKFSFPRVAMT